MISPNPILSGRCEVRSHATICTCLEQHAFLHRKLTKSKNSESITLTPHKLTHHKRESPEPRKRFCDTATLLSNGRRVLRRAQKVARQKWPQSGGPGSVRKKTMCGGIKCDAAWQYEALPGRKERRLKVRKKSHRWGNRLKDVKRRRMKRKHRKRHRATDPIWTENDDARGPPSTAT